MGRRGVRSPWRPVPSVYGHVLVHASVHTGGMPDIPDTSVGRDRPWSQTLAAPIRYLITILSAVAVGFIGTFAHRMGASSNMPYGLILALAIVTMSAWCARSRDGVVALSIHLIVSSLVVWGMALTGSESGATAPVGFTGSDLPYFSQHVGYMWLFGMVIVQVALVMVPRRFFNASGRMRRRSVRSGARLGFRRGRGGEGYR